jgi:large subunit ribosomal protein L29
MKMAELNKMTDEQLNKRLASLREQIRDLNFKIHSKEVKNNHMVASVKKDIARILTILNAR